MSRSQGHSVCFQNMSRPISLQGLTLAAEIAAEKHILMHSIMSRSLE